MGASAWATWTAPTTTSRTGGLKTRRKTWPPGALHGARLVSQRRLACLRQQGLLARRARLEWMEEPRLAGLEPGCEDRRALRPQIPPQILEDRAPHPTFST